MSEEVSPKFDIENISFFLQLDNNIVEALDKNILFKLSAKANEFNRLKAENLKCSVTLDELKSLSERKVQALKENVESLLHEAQGHREKLTNVEEEKMMLNDEKIKLSSEINRLKSCISDMNDQKELYVSDKQDLVKLFEEKVSELEMSKNEIRTLLETNKTLRQNSLELETTIQNSKSQDLRHRSEIEHLKQELNLSKSNNVWLNDELQAKNEQLHIHREKTNNDIHELVTELNSVKNELKICQSNCETFKEKTLELSKEIQTKIIEVKQLSDTLSDKKHEFTHEMMLKQRLVDLLEKQVASMKGDLEKAYNSISDMPVLDNEKQKLIDEVVDLKSRLDTSNEKVIKQEETINELLKPMDNNNGIESSSVTDNQFNISKLYGDIGSLRKQLILERRQKEQLQHQVEIFVVELEHKIPALNSFKDRVQVLETELNDISLLLESTLKSRDEKDHELKGIKSKVTSYESQINSLTKQRYDLARQVEYLLIQVSVRNDDKGPLTPEEVRFITRIINSSDSSSESDTQQIISERLVLFKSIEELQKNNTDLLNTVRNLADKLEEEEKKSKSIIDSISEDAIKDAKEAILALTDRNKSLEEQLEIIIKERDAFKVLHSKDIHNKSLNVTSNKHHIIQQQEQKIHELEERLKILTSESDKNIKLLNDEIQGLFKKVSTTMVSLEREKASRALSEDRLKLLNTTLEMTKCENRELQQKFQDFQKITLSQDKRTQETVESLIRYKSEISKLTSQLAILQSERDLLRSSGDSLKKEMSSISKENVESRILISQLQSIQRERDSLLEETQKGCQSKITNLENTLSVVKTTLDNKDKELRDQYSSKAAELKWFQNKIDLLNEELKKKGLEDEDKNTLIIKLESKIKILSSKLDDAEVRARSYSLLTSIDGASIHMESLCKELEKGKIQLSDAYSQIDHFKELSKSAEDSVSGLTKALQETQSQHSLLVSEFNKVKEDLNDHINILNDQIKDLNSELDHQKAQAEKENMEYKKQISSLEVESQGINELKLNYENNILKLEEDLNQQAAYANQAQRNYEQELQKHADVSKTISLLREELQKVKTEAITLKNKESEAEQALKESELSWVSKTTDYENQISFLNQRIEDLTSQNVHLFDQVELLTSDSKSDSTLQEPLSKESRELLISLRRERDVLETKYEVATREEKILRQRLEVIQSELKTTRIELGKLRSVANENTSLMESNAKIMEELNQLNLLRESNMTLRSEYEKSNAHCKQIENHLEEAQAKLQPLKLDISMLQNLVSEKDQQIVLCKEETQRWKQRSQDILSKYERIDPSEHQKLVNEVESLKKEIQTKSDENTELQDRFKKLRQQAHERLDSFKTREANIISDLGKAKELNNSLENQLNSEKEKSAELESKLHSFSNLPQDSTLQRDLDLSQERLKESEEMIESLKEKLKSLEFEISKIQQMKDEGVPLENQLNQFEILPEQISSLPDEARKIIEQVKNEYENEKVKLIAQKEKELQDKFERDKLEALNAQQKELNSVKEFSGNTGESIDIDLLKAKWTEEYEKKTLQRITEAEESLKRRIRLPSEQKIENAIEKKRKALESEFSDRVNQKVLEVLKENPDSLIGGKADVIRKHNIEVDNLRKELKAKYEAQAAEIRKRSLEEGKQQASMKTKLLESKIAKLESQVKHGIPNSSVPTKILVNDNFGINDKGSFLKINSSPLQYSGNKDVRKNIPSFNEFKAAKKASDSDEKTKKRQLDNKEDSISKKSKDHDS